MLLIPRDFLGQRVSRSSSAFIVASKVDPKHLFSKWGSVGYSKNDDNEGNVDCGDNGEKGTSGSSNTFD